jgi:type IV pilus assembly protein PilC
VPQFTYVAVAPDGKKTKGAIDAMSEEALRNELLARNFEVKSVKAKKNFNQIELTPQRVPTTEIMHFSRQVAAFVRSGIPIIDALEVIEEGTENKRFKAILADMRESVTSGSPFSDAVEAHASIFPPYYMGILRSSELTGQLDTALEQLSEYIERDVEAKHEIKSALTYPAVIIVMSLCTVIILATFVLPKFTKFFEQMNAELPIQTKLLMWIANFFKTFWFVTPLVFLGIGLLIYLGKTTVKGRKIRDRLFLRLPMMGTIVRYAVIERFCRVVAAMVRAGVPLPDSMTAAIAAANNKVFEVHLLEVQEKMLEGEGLADPIAVTKLFPRAATQMMKVGEDTGTLDIQLENAAQYYSRELQFKLKKLTSLFEPLVIVFMGVVVGFVAVALISAMYGVLSGQKTPGGPAAP